MYATYAMNECYEKELNMLYTSSYILLFHFFANLTHCATSAVQVGATDGNKGGSSTEPVGARLAPTLL